MNTVQVTFFKKITIVLMYSSIQESILFECKLSLLSRAPRREYLIDLTSSQKQVSENIA